MKFSIIKNHCILEKRFLLLFIFLSFFFIPIVKAQEFNKPIPIPLENGKFLLVQICNQSIVRIRISDKNDFPQSLMERYGIVKNDWDDVKYTLKSENGNKIFNTDGFQININQKAGEISIKDANGKSIIDRVAFSDEKSKIVSEFGESLNKHFGIVKSGGGIIGDVNYTGLKSDQSKMNIESDKRLLEISLNNDERFYGGGNTSRKNIQHRGEVLKIWATYQKTEIPVPFLMSSAGWGIFNNTTSLNYFDIGRFQNDKLLVYNTGGDLDFFLMLGKSMPEVLYLYTTITGKSYVLPKWAYGLAFGGNQVENLMDIMNDAVRFRDEKIPCDLFWIEPQWMKKNYDFSSSKSWNLDKFPAEPFWEANNPNKYEHPSLFISKLHGMGYKLALWLCIDHDLSISEEDQITGKTGKPQSGLEHWFPHLNKFIDQGVNGFKLDPGRTLDEHPERKYYNGFSDKEMHNLNQTLLPKQMYQTFREHKNVRSFHHYCGGYAGSQHWGASTSGDNGGDKDALFDQLNLGLSGFTNTSADVLEYVKDNKAGLHLGFFLPWVQINSWYGLHHPWYMKPDEKETFRQYAQLRNSLFPYIYSASLEGSQTGLPILRAMPLAYPNDRKVDNLIYQYMFGENLLVGVFNDSIYLPDGNWINYWTNEKITGNKTVYCKRHKNTGGPLLIKAGAIIPYQKPMQYIGENPIDTLILKVYPDKLSSYNLLEDDGISFDFEKGKIAKTRFECNDTDEETVFTIFPTQGNYEGILSSRVYQIEVFIDKKPRRVNIDDEKIKSWNYYTSNKLTIIVNQKKLSEKHVISIIK